MSNHGYAVVRCEMCDQNVCQLCLPLFKKIHLSDNMKNHEIIHFNRDVMNDNRYQIRLPSCPRHAEKVCHLWCSDCSLAVCQTCTQYGHLNHKFDNLVNMGESRCSELDIVKKNLQNKLDSYKKIMLDVESLRKEGKTAIFEMIRIHFENEKNNLNKWMRDILNSMDLEEQGIKRKLRDIFDDVDKEETEYLESLTNELWRIENLNDYLDYLIKDAKYNEITRETCEKIADEISIIQNPIPYSNRNIQLIPEPSETTNFTIIKLSIDELIASNSHSKYDKQKLQTNSDLEERIKHKLKITKSGISQYLENSDDDQKRNSKIKLEESSEMGQILFSKQAYHEQTDRKSENNSFSMKDLR